MFLSTPEVIPIPARLIGACYLSSSPEGSFETAQDFSRMWQGPSTEILLSWFLASSSLPHEHIQGILPATWEPVS